VSPASQDEIIFLKNITSGASTKTFNFTLLTFNFSSMSLKYSPSEIFETAKLLSMENFDIRTVTLGINLLPCADSDFTKLAEKVEKKIKNTAKDLIAKAEKIEAKYGVPIINKRITITPASLVLESALSGNFEKDQKTCVRFAKHLDKIAKSLRIDFIGGFGGFAEKGITYSDKVVIESLPEVMKNTERVCAFYSLASTKHGINMRAIAKFGSIIHEISKATPKGVGCAKLVLFANAVSDNPFMAGGFHGPQEADAAINIGISGPGVIRQTIEKNPKDLPLDKLANLIKQIAFKITRVGELMGREIAKEIGVTFGIVDLSLAPTTKVGDSIGRILESIGLETVGTHGTTAALYLLTDAVKKGGIMASQSVGGLSGAFIPVSEDIGMIESARQKVLNIDKLEAMTSVCSVGLDMVAIPGNTKTTTIAAIIADEMAIGVANHKTTGVRIIPVPGKKAGDYVKWGGLLGESVIMPVHQKSSDIFIWRKGHIPPPITSFRN
jgi:uncharacterized protein